MSNKQTLFVDKIPRSPPLKTILEKSQWECQERLEEHTLDVAEVDTGDSPAHSHRSIPEDEAKTYKDKYVNCYFLILRQILLQMCLKYLEFESGIKFCR